MPQGIAAEPPGVAPELWRHGIPLAGDVVQECIFEKVGWVVIKPAPIVVQFFAVGSFHVSRSKIGCLTQIFEVKAGRKADTGGNLVR